MGAQKKYSNGTRRRGFTLLELLVSAGVLSLVSVVIAQVVFTTVRLSSRTEQMKEMKQVGGIVMDSMKRMIQNAKDISYECDGTPKSQLTILNVDGGEAVISCQFDPVFETFRIASASSTFATTSYISSANVALVTSSGASGCGLANSEDAALSFTCFDNTTVQIVFRLRLRNMSTGLFEGVQETFQSTIIKRNK